MTDNPLVRSAVITCILNSRAGSNRPRHARDQIADLFARHGAQVRILLAQKGSEIPNLARRAMAEGSQPVVAAGGDGTVRTVAAALVGTETALGILPLGTLNHFAKDCKIPLELDAAIANLFTGGLARVDVGEVNGHIFVNNSSLGLYPAIVREREKRQRQGVTKWVAFTLALVSILWRYAPLHVWLGVDSLPESRRSNALCLHRQQSLRDRGIAHGRAEPSGWRQAVGLPRPVCRRGHSSAPRDESAPRAGAARRVRIRTRARNAGYERKRGVCALPRTGR